MDDRVDSNDPIQKRLARVEDQLRRLIMEPAPEVELPTIPESFVLSGQGWDSAWGDWLDPIAVGDNPLVTILSIDSPYPPIELTNGETYLVDVNINWNGAGVRDVYVGGTVNALQHRVSVSAGGNDDYRHTFIVVPSRTQSLKIGIHNRSGSTIYADNSGTAATTGPVIKVRVALIP